MYCSVYHRKYVTPPNARRTSMKFMTIKDLRTSTAAMRRNLEAEEEIVLTANGRPIALLTAVDPEHLEQELLASRKARARAALDRIRSRAQAAGTADLPMRAVTEVVGKARALRPR